MNVRFIYQFEKKYSVVVIPKEGFNCFLNNYLPCVVS